MEKKLSKMKPGDKGKIIRIDSSARGGIAGMGIRKGKIVKVASEQPVGGPIVVEIDGNKSSLGRGIAETVLVEVGE
ncbi:MAG: ferrous iron transport protein A [Candidatus Hadarchaeia archaeon]